MGKAYPLWDLPLRLFHWSLVILVPAAWWTAEEGHMDWHQWCGYAVIVLVGFRLLWGLLGSRHARFSDFLRGPRAVLSYLRDGSGAGAGHNPLGGWAVMVLLLLLLAQGVTGLFNSDDILFDGPLRHAVDSDLAGTLGAWHEWVFDALVVMLVLHLCAISWYQWHRGQPLVQAMWRGQAGEHRGEAPPAPWWLALLALAVVACLLWWVISQAPPPPSYW